MVMPCSVTVVSDRMSPVTSSNVIAVAPVWKTTVLAIATSIGKLRAYPFLIINILSPPVNVLSILRHSAGN